MTPLLDPATTTEAQNVGHRFQDGHWRCGKCRYEWMPRNTGRDPKKCPRCWAWLDKPLNGGKA